MAAESNGPNIHLPGADSLSNFLDGTDQQDAQDTAILSERDNVADEDSEETPEPPSYQESFDRKYVEKLRRENASYRDRAKKAEEVWAGYEEGAADEWRELITNFRSDPKSVAERMKELSETILENFTPAEQEAIKDAIEDEEQPLTMSQLQTILKEREQQWEMDSLVSDIETEARELGYNLKSREYKVLLMTAQELPSGSIQEAHEMILAERQRVIDEYVAEREKESGRVLPSKTVGAPGQEKKITDFKGAKEALSQYLDANFR